jgi:hypothetical protein
VIAAVVSTRLENRAGQAHRLRTLSAPDQIAIHDGYSGNRIKVTERAVAIRYYSCFDPQK